MSQNFCAVCKTGINPQERVCGESFIHLVVGDGVVVHLAVDPSNPQSLGAALCLSEWLLQRWASEFVENWLEQYTRCLSVSWGSDSMPDDVRDRMPYDGYIDITRVTPNGRWVW